MSVEGSLDLFSMPEILQLIAQQGKTGILTIQGQEDIVAISFLSGRIVAADSLAHTVEQGLSQVLASEGLLSSAQLARAHAEIQAGGGRLLDLLVERRYLTRKQLLGALRLQTARQVEALLRWRQGDFKFYGGDEVSFEEGFEPIAVEDLLLRTLAEFAGPPASPPAARPRPAPGPAGGGDDAAAQASMPTPPATTVAEAGASAGARVAPAPGGAAGGAARVRRVPARPPRGGEPWPSQLPHLPELPEAAMPVSTPPAALRPLSLPAVPAPRPRSRSEAGTAGPAGGGGAAGPAGPALPTAALSQAAPAAAAPLTPAPPHAEPLPWPAAVMTPPPAPATAPGATLGRAPASPAVPPALALGGRHQVQGAPASRPEGRSAEDAPGGPGTVPALSAALGPLPKQFRQMQIERPDRAVSPAARIAVAVLALGVAVALAVAAVRAPDGVLLPFPWATGERATFVRNQRESLYDKIEGAAKTAFLRDGRFPDQLAQLRDTGLLAAGDLDDPRGEPLLYAAREDSYTLQATDRGRPLADADTSASIAGNFFLDPNLLQSAPTSGPPIVLLD